MQEIEENKKFGKTRDLFSKVKKKKNEDCEQTTWFDKMKVDEDYEKKKNQWSGNTASWTSGLERWGIKKW